MNRRNQVPHLTQNATWESDKKHENITYKIEVRHFKEGDHKYAMNRQESMTNTKHCCKTGMACGINRCYNT